MMEYPYFAASQPFPYLGVPQTSIPTSTPANQDEFNNSIRIVPLQTTSLSAHPYRQAAEHQPSASSSFTPDHQLVQYQHQHQHQALSQKQAPFERYEENYTFQTFNHTSPAHVVPPLPKPPTPLPQAQSRAVSISHNVSTHAYDMGTDMNDDATKRGSNSEGDDDFNPRQTRRKEQNRAAQRAFRERKERHVKELEAKLAAMEKNSASVAEENERLKLQLQRAATENEMLKASSGNSHRAESEPLHKTGMRSFTPTGPYLNSLETDSDVVFLDGKAQKLLAASSTWDYIIKHPLYMRGMVDVGNVSDRLKQVIKCYGRGLVYLERDVVDALERSVASGSDELL